MESAAAPGAGNVSIELDGKDHEMVPTLGACIAISGIAGGLNSAISRCLALDFETIRQVIQAGIGLNPTQARMLPEAIFKTGLIVLARPCIEFIEIVANGGRPPSEEGGEEGDPPLPA